VSKKIALFAIEQMNFFLLQCPTHHAWEISFASIA
jgi:hypothetical protein